MPLIRDVQQILPIQLLRQAKITVLNISLFNFTSATGFNKKLQLLKQNSKSSNYLCHALVVKAVKPCVAQNRCFIIHNAFAVTSMKSIMGPRL